MFLNYWVLILLLIGIGEKVHLQKLINESAEICIGSTEDEVLRVIGEPMTRWKPIHGLARFFFGERPAQWSWGTTIDIGFISVPSLPFMNPIPIKIRLFSPDEDDLVVDWTPDKHVSRIVRPPQDVPDRVVALFEPMYFVGDIMRALARCEH